MSGDRPMQSKQWMGGDVIVPRAPFGRASVSAGTKRSVRSRTPGLVGMLVGFLAGMPCVALGAAEAKDAPRERVVMGWLESVFFRPWNVRMTAKLDTGANTSSLHAERLERFTRGGQKWVRFTVVKSDDKKFVVERPVVRTANIKQHGKGSAQREVVTMVLCKNGRDYDTEFTLVDRSNFSYPVLLGRSFLKNAALVDANETFLFKAEHDPCKKGGSD
jgi:hypothetical protein